MAKQGDKYTSPDGKQWVFTSGGNWREYVNGKPTNNVSKGATPPGGAPGGAAGAGAPQTVENQTPPKLSPSGTAYLNDSKNKLQQQVAQGLINQAQADQEYGRRQQQVSAASPAIQDSMWNLQQQVAQGLINQSTADNEVYRQSSLENQTQPNTNTNLDANSSTSQVQNEIADSAKGYTAAGNILTNPNQNGPFGNRNVSVDPVTGQPVVNDTLSGANQNVLGGIQGTSVKASDVAQGLLGNQYNQFVQGAGPQSGYSDPALEQATYERLTRGNDQEKRIAYDQKQQELANRGIGVGNKAYSDEMDRFSRSWDEKDRQARDSAVQQSTATALQRQQNNVGALGALTGGVSSLGQTAQGGFYQPNFQNFQSAQYQQPDVQGLYNTQYAGQLTREQIDADIEKQKIAAGATLGAAGIAADASKSNAALAASSRPQTSNFSTKPPGS